MNIQEEISFLKRISRQQRAIWSLYISLCAVSCIAIAGWVLYWSCKK